MVNRMDTENLHYFEKAPVAKAVAHFAIPMMLGTSMSVIYSILNAFFIGTLNNTAMLTALALTLPLFAVIMALGNLIGVGSSAFISRLLGEKIRLMLSMCLHSPFTAAWFSVLSRWPSACRSLILSYMASGQRLTPSDLPRTTSPLCLLAHPSLYYSSHWRVLSARREPR